METIYQFIKSGQYTVSAGYGATIPGRTSGSFSPGSGTVVSVGFQNNGNAVSCWASQLFVTDSGTVYFEICNAAPSSTDFWIWCVVDTTSAPSDYSIMQSQQYTTPGGGIGFSDPTIKSTSGEIASVGVQNIDNATNFSIPKVLVSTPKEAYVQTCNWALSATNWCVWSVVNSQKNYNIVTSQTYTCEKGSSLPERGTQSVQFVPGGGTVVSVGVQVFSESSDTFVTQMFVIDGANVYVQVSTTSNSFDWCIWCVVDPS